MSKTDMLDSILKNIQKISVELRRYIEKRIELLTLEAGDQVSSWLALSLWFLLFISIVALAVIFILFALSSTINVLTNTIWAGPVSVAIGLLLTALVVFITKSKIEGHIKYRIDQQVLKQEPDKSLKLLEHTPQTSTSESTNNNEQSANG
jgi:hypothetical protein